MLCVGAPPSCTLHRRELGSREEQLLAQCQSVAWGHLLGQKAFLGLLLCQDPFPTTP